MSDRPRQSVQATPFGKYRLLTRLGQGGMGEVWRASVRTPEGPERIVVVKRVLADLLTDSDAVQMFEREARLCARLAHPNIIETYELGEVDGEYYLAMEYVDGVDAWRLMRDLRKLDSVDPGFAAFTMAGVCRALDYAHKLPGDDGLPLHVVHRDVSPSNIMISFAGKTKLLDFGIAKVMSVATEFRTRSGALKGKLSYLSPEQVDGQKRPDHRSDQFSAGVVLHELLTGARLFRGEADIDTIALVREAAVRAPSLLNERVPRDLDELCLRALARDPAERHADCGALGDALATVAARLGWDESRSAKLLDELFPGGTTELTRVSIQLASAAQGTASIVAPPPARPRRRWAVLGSALVAALVGIVIATRGTTKVAAPTPIAVPVAPAARPALVHVEIVSTPSGADVVLGNEATIRGRTPLRLELDRGDRASSVSVRLAGYQTSVVSLTPDRDSKLQVSLARVAMRPVEPPRPIPKKTVVSRSASHPSKHVPSKAAHEKDLRHGAVVDPFGP